MTVAHVCKQSGHHDDFKHEIKPRFADKQRNVKRNGTRIECQDIRIFHQRKTHAPELVAKLLRDIVTVFLLHQRIEALEIRSHPLLLARIVSIRIQKQLPPEIMLPGQAVEQFPLLLEVVELAPCLSFQEFLKYHQHASGHEKRDNDCHYHGALEIGDKECR